VKTLEARFSYSGRRYNSQRSIRPDRLCESESKIPPARIPIRRGLPKQMFRKKPSAGIRPGLERKTKVHHESHGRLKRTHESPKRHRSSFGSRPSCLPSLQIFKTLPSHSNRNNHAGRPFKSGVTQCRSYNMRSCPPACSRRDSMSLKALCSQPISASSHRASTLIRRLSRATFFPATIAMACTLTISAQARTDFSVDFTNGSELAGEGPVLLAKAAPLVPSGFTINGAGSGTANIVIRATSCASVAVNGHHPQPTNLSRWPPTAQETSITTQWCM
jgi:hypothetical protein